MVARWSDAGIVSFSSTLSEPFINESSSTSSSSVRAGGGLVAVVIANSFCYRRIAARSAGHRV